MKLRVFNIGNILLESKIVDISMIIILGIYSIPGYMIVMNNYGYGILEIFTHMVAIFIPIWILFIMIKVFIRAIIMNQNCFKPIIESLKQFPIAFLEFVSIIGYFLFYEFNNPNKYIYFIPIITIVLISLIRYISYFRAYNKI